MIDDTNPARRAGVFGRYTLLGRAEWLCGAEYQAAFCTGPGGGARLVFLKRASALVEPDRVDGLNIEAAIAGRLCHGNVLRLLDAGAVGFVHYLAYEHVHGITLDRLLREECWRDPGASPPGTGVPLAQAIAIGIGICEALLHAHGRAEGLGASNRVHGSLSPGAVFVSFEGEVKVTGFGVWEPEPGPGERASARSDLFALGQLLRELIRGRRGREVGPNLPLELEAILLRALDPGQPGRIESVSQMLRELEQFARQAGLDTSSLALSTWLRMVASDHERAQRGVMEPAFTHSGGTPPRETDDGGPHSGPISSVIPAATYSVPPQARRGRAHHLLYSVGLLTGAGLTLVLLRWQHQPSSPPLDLREARALNAVPSPPALDPPGRVDGTAAPRRITVDSEPAGAVVSLNRAPADRLTPFALDLIPNERAVLHFERDGYEPAEVVVEPAGAPPEGRVVARLTPAALSLRVLVSAPKAQVWVDGVYRREGEARDLAVGIDHLVGVSAPGFIGKYLFVRADHGGERTLPVKLRPVLPRGAGSRSYLQRGGGGTDGT